MNTDEIVLSVIDYLNKHEVPYMLVGSLATNVYCVPRSTEDGDVVVQSDVAKLAPAIARAHSNIHFDPQIAFESVTATRKVVLQTKGHGFEVELFQLSGDEHDQARFARRVKVETMGRHGTRELLDRLRTDV
jgi:hypothetical protein